MTHACILSPLHQSALCIIVIARAKPHIYALQFLKDSIGKLLCRCFTSQVARNHLAFCDCLRVSFSLAQSF